MAYKLLIESVDQTALLDAYSLFVNMSSDYRGTLSFSLTTTANDIWTTDGLCMGQTCEFLEDTTVIFGGVVKTINITRLEPIIGSDSLIRVYISVMDYNEIATRRISSNVYENMYAGAIVTSYVNAVLGLSGYDDNVGIGTINDGAMMTAFSSQAESVKESLDKLAEASGFKWYIDSNKNMNFIAENTIVDAPYELVETTPTFTDFNIIDIAITTENYRNKQWVIGQFDETGEQIAVSVENSAEIAYRALVENNSGIYSDTIRDTESQTIEDATIVATNALKRYGTMPYILTFTTFTNDFVAGTRLKANLPTIGINADMYFLVENVVIEDMGSVLRSTVTCTRRSETEFSTQRTEDYKDYFAKLIANATSVSNTVISGGSGVYVQEEAPSGVADKTLWVDTNAYNKYDAIAYSSNATLSIEDGELIFASGTITLTLFSANGQQGVMAIFKNTGTGVITIATTGTETIDGASTYSLPTQYSKVTLVSNGSNWSVI